MLHCWLGFRSNSRLIFKWKIKDFILWLTLLLSVTKSYQRRIVEHFFHYSKCLFEHSARSFCLSTLERINFIFYFQDMTILFELGNDYLATFNYIIYYIREHVSRLFLLFTNFQHKMLFNFWQKSYICHKNTRSILNSIHWIL